jgi:hypothetical protein
MTKRGRPLLWAALILLQTAVVARSQHSARPQITRRVKSERVRDEKLEEAIRRSFPEYPKMLEGEIDYYYNRVDLDGDGKPEVLVFLFGPQVCGTGGCDALVFKSAKGGYRVVGDIALARNPIIVSEHKTHGWRDLIMFIAGGGVRPGYYSVVPFNGKQYPENPSGEPLSFRQRGTAYLVGSPVIGSGIVLVPPAAK